MFGVWGGFGVGSGSGKGYPTPPLGGRRGPGSPPPHRYFAQVKEIPLQANKLAEAERAAERVASPCVHLPAAFIMYGRYSGLFWAGWSWMFIL